MTGFTKSTLLYRYPSVSKGVARTVSIIGGLDTYNTSDTENEADTKALNRDWNLVGEDIDKATLCYEESSE